MVNYTRKFIAINFHPKTFYKHEKVPFILNYSGHFYFLPLH
jgi:hypothetical protein